LILFKETDEFLVPVTGHALADDAALQHVERGEQRGRAVALIIVRHRPAAALLHRQSRLGAVERLDLRLLVDRQNQGVLRRIDIKADDIVQLGGKLRIVRQFEGSHPVGL
jgi:dihydroxyacetone kinase